MKKLILMLFLVVGGVMSAGATDYVLAGPSAIANGLEWNNSADVNKLQYVDDDIYYIVVDNCNLYTGTNYNWQIVEKGTWNKIAQWNEFYVSESGVYTMIYIFKNKVGEISTTCIPVKNLTLSNNYTSTPSWNEDNSDFYFTHIAGTTKWTFEIDAADVSDSWRFRVWTSGIYTGDGWHNIAANAEGTSLNFATNSDAAYAANDTNNSWEVTYPDFPFEKYIISMDYDVLNYKWVVRADAYISKTVSGENQYATIGAPVPLDLSVVAASGVTAYKLAANASTGVITKTEKTDALAANEGALLENKTGSDVVLSIPVAASAVADGSNQLKAFTGVGKLAQVSETGFTNYILTKESEHVGFYKVNDAGNSMGANTAYLHVPDAGAARMAFFFDESEATAIQNVEKIQENGRFFNLNGQRVAQPQKGLYIVNGKKMLMK